MQSELETERQMSQLIIKDKEELLQQKTQLEARRAKEIEELQEQLRDLMLHFDAQQKVQEEMNKGGVTNEVRLMFNIFLRITRQVTYNNTG